jgi:DNA-binding winged helix-turn-helix (wHTH) protein
VGYFMNDGCRSAHRVRFGNFEADFQTQELWKNATKLKLARQPFQILEMLLSNPGGLVTREDMQRRLWPEDHFVDAAHGLNAAVNKLRDTLGDSADEPRFIETLPRRGYRFVGHVERDSPAVGAGEATVRSEDSMPEPGGVMLPVSAGVRSSPATRSWPILAIACAALVLGGMIGISLTNAVKKSAARSAERAPGMFQIPLEKSNERPEISQKTQGVAHRSPKLAPPLLNHSGAIPLWRPEPHMQLQGADFRTIVPGNNGNAAPQFSPDGKHIAFMSDRSGPWQIWMSNADGSNPVQVSFTQSAGTPRWSPDGRSLAFDAPFDGTTSVFIAPIDHPQDAHPVAEGRVASFSRDGQYLYFASDRNDDWQIWKVSINGGAEVQVTKSGGFAPLQSDDGYLYYVKSEHEPQLWRIPINGGAESVVSPLARPRTWSSWTVTCEGILLAVDLPDGKTYLNLYDPTHGSMRELVPLQSAPHWMGATLDGKRVVVNDAAERQITMLENLH